MLGLLTKQYGISEEAAAELLFDISEESGELDRTKVKDGALDALLAKDTERVKSLKGTVDKTAIYNKAYDDAKKKILPKEEKKLAEEYGIELNGQKLTELVAAIVDTQVAAKSGEVNDETVKKHPLYLAIERKAREELDAATTAHEQALTDLKNGYARKETLGTVKTNARGIFMGLNPVLSEDPTKAENQVNRFLQQFESFNYQQDGNTWILLDEEGNRLEDDHGQPITLNSKVSGLANSEFDFKKQSDKGGAGNTNTPGGGGGTMTEDEYQAKMFEASTPEERAAITAQYEGT